MPQMSGGCRCGQVRYAADAEPVFVGVCHCRDCQKSTGSAFAVLVGVPGAAVTVTGPIRMFDALGDSGKATHLGFCPHCGTGMTRSADLMAGVTMLSAGTLDDPSWVEPTLQIYCDSAQPWVSLGGEMKRFAKMPG